METPTRLLAVDDSATIRKAFELILAPAGFAVEFAATASEGLAKARDQQPTIVLLDFILPDMLGSDVARALLMDERTARIPVILISTKGAEIRQAYRDIANVVAYITKPFTPDQVLNAVGEVLARGTAGGFFKSVPLEPGTPAGKAIDGEAPRTNAPTTTPATPAPQEPLNGIGILNGPSVSLSTGDESWSDHDGVTSDDEEVFSSAAGTAARASLEHMFETLLAGLEGVYVEEVDTPAGAVADQAKSYTDLASHLTRQLGETLEHAKSGARFGLCSDGSVQSLADMLLDTHRRVCRLLFRAAAAGAVESEVDGHSRARVLVVRRPDSEAIEQLLAPSEDAGACHVFAVTSDFRQLPLMLRLYGPTHLVVDIAQHAALWDQLRVALSLPEAGRLHIFGVRSAHATSQPVDAATLAELGIAIVIPSGPSLRDALHDHIAASGHATSMPTPLASAARTAGTLLS